MNPVTHIRQNVFQCATQEEFAALLKVSQATISRWEDWGRIPGHRQKMVRQKATRRGLAWDDRFFFEAPDAPPTAPVTSAPRKLSHAGGAA